jgi:hypothetical protein
MASTYSGGVGKLQLITDGEKTGLWGQITNANLQVLEEMISGYVTHDVAGSATTTLAGDANVGTSYSASEAKALIVKFTGTKTGNHDVILPAREGWWIFWDGSAGAYDLTLKVTGGTGLVMSRGGKSLVFTDGTTAAPQALDSLPSQSGEDGKFLKTDSGSASWATLDTDANTTTKGLYEMAHTISSNYSITSTANAMSAGPITINASITVTVPATSTWVIV